MTHHGADIAGLPGIATPPADVPEMQRGEWLPLTLDDEMVRYLTAFFWPGGTGSPAWHVARLSSAAHVYQEQATGWAIVAKYHGVKTGEDAGRHAQREWDAVAEAHAAGLAGGDVRALRAHGLWRGTILLEYVEGLTLHDSIAVRRSQPGMLVPRLQATARLLATLHGGGAHPDVPAGFQPAVSYAHRVIDNLSRWGVLQDQPHVVDALRTLVGRWAERREMSGFNSVLLHGDATTTNFVFPSAGGVVGVDWERASIGDPAADLGRLMAEVAHSIAQLGGGASEAEPFLGRLAEAYRHALAPGIDAEALLHRARFYRATSTLRVARNGWLSRQVRLALVAEGMALLVQQNT
ncbi:MAG TPA: phosphotransferase [Anaerolineae bacterium]|nr:phosphotransferase [Anaerolineae bacterium]